MSRSNHARIRLWTCVATALFAAAQALAGGASLRAEQETLVYYFCADSHVDNYAVLKSAFDHYLVPRSRLRFQPVRRWKDFERLLDAATPAYFIMNGATFANVGPPRRLMPALASEWRESLFEHYDLYLGRAVVEETGGATPVIATSFTAEAANRLIDEILTDAGYTNIPSFRLLQVPKHLDALIATRLGLADAALAPRDASDGNGHFDEARRLRGRPYLRLVVARNENIEQSTDLEALRRMHEDAEGARALQLIRVTRFLSTPRGAEEAP